MEWNGIKNGMEGEFWYGIWKMLRMEDLKNGMKYRLSYFHTTYNAVLKLTTNCNVLP